MEVGEVSSKEQLKNLFKKKSILFLVPYPVGQAPSQRFRFEQYFDLLEQKGHNITVKSFISNNTWKILYSEGKIIRKGLDIFFSYIRRIKHVFFDAKRADIVFIHREVAPLGPPIFEFIIAKLFRKKIIYDFDDAIWLSNTSVSNRLVAFLKWHQKTGYICKWSWKISVGNDYLASYAENFNSNVIINPTTIDTNYHKPNRNQINEKFVIGWTGTHSTLKYLENILPALEVLRDDGDIVIKIISNEPPKIKSDFITFVKWNKNTEIQDLSAFDVGLMPLTEDQWTKGKCGFKALQYMALEIPVLLSPVGVNKDIVTHGKNGYFCTTINEWRSYLSLLKNSREKCKQIGKAAREKVELHFSVKSNNHNFISLFRN